MSKEQSAKMWSGRFREPLDATFESWQRSFPFDWRLIPYEVEASIAHARAIEAAGILTSEELLQTEEGLRAVAKQQAEQGEAIVTANPQAEDVHHYVELELTKQIGDLALKLHTGRSRNEQIATDMRLFVREAIDNTLAGLTVWRKALVELAEQAGEATMPSYTHLQRAEPVLVAHWLLAYVTMIERDASRLTDARKRMNLCPLGSGAVAGATLALDRTIAARALSFDAPTPNSMDATSDRDFALEFTQAIATLGIHIKGLPLAYNKDLQEGQEPVFDAADTIAGILSVLPAFTASLKFRYDTMKTAAHSGYLNAMAAATYLTDKGIPFRKAHEHIGNAVRLGLETQRELQQLTLEELRNICPAFGEDFFPAITLEATLDCHDVIGGTARNRVATALAEAKTRLAQ